MKPTRFSQIVIPLAVVVLLAHIAPRPAEAGLKGQPQPTASVAGKLQTTAATLARADGDKNAARPELLALVEANGTTDLTFLLSPALGDGNTYSALLATLDDVLQTQPSDEGKAFVRYNMARISLFRARALQNRNDKALPLAHAEVTLKDFDANTVRDPAYWELMGDVQAERDDPDAAAISYKKIVTSGGDSAQAQFKTAVSYATAKRMEQAKAAFEAGIRADAANGYTGGKQMKHQLYQGLAGLYLSQGDDKNAVAALLLSAKVTQDESAPFRLRLNHARQLLTRGGHAVEVLTYANAALKFAPDDAETKAFHEAAAAAALP